MLTARYYLALSTLCTNGFRKARFSFQIQLKWWKPPLFTKGYVNASRQGRSHPRKVWPNFRAADYPRGAVSEPGTTS